MANLYGPRIVTDGLTMHLDASNTKSYPGTGTTVYDIAGNYNHTLSGNIFTTVDNVKCFDCTGTGRIVDAGTTFTLGSNHTFVAWARPLSNANSSNWRTLWRTQPHDHPLLINYGTGGVADGTIGYYDNNNGLAFVSFGVNVATLGIENKWTMFTVEGNNGGSFLYINDTYVGYANRNAAGMEQDAISTAGGSQPFGYVATATIYKDKSLSADEIAQNYNALKGRFGL